MRENSGNTTRSRLRVVRPVDTMHMVNSREFFRRPAVHGHHHDAKSSRPKHRCAYQPTNEQLDQIEKCEALNAAGLIHWSAKGVPRYKSYLSMREGAHVGDIIIDIYRVTGDEDVGYPTTEAAGVVGADHRGQVATKAT